MPFFEVFVNVLSQVLYLTGYIKRTTSFPPALSPAEEKECLKRLFEGDMEARRILIEHNLRLVAHIAKKYADESSMDDYISVGTIGLIKGIDTYDKEKCSKLSSYISRCIENEVLMVIRNNKKRVSDISMDESVGTDRDGNSLTLSDILPAEGEDIADIIWARIEGGKLYSAMREVLTPVEIDILWKRYGLSNSKRKTQREIADELGISRSYVSRIEKKCLKKLRERLSRE